MKKFIFCLLSFSIAVLCPLNASERVVWTGDSPISWNTEVYEGTQFETPDGIFAGLKVQDTISVTVVAHIDEPQYVLTYKAGSSWEWTNLENITVADGLMTYIVESEQIAIEIADRGLIFRGQGYNITQIAIVSPDEDPEPEPEPVILVEGDTTTLWEDSTGLEMAWNEICEQDTSIGQQLAEKDKIIVTVIAKNPTTEWPKVILRNADSEEVTNQLINDISTFPYDVTFTLTAEYAAAVQQGFRISGDGVTVTKVAAYKYKEGDDPQPSDTIDYSGLVETVVYAPESPVAISWDETAYAGTKIDTRNISETMFAGLQEDNIIRVTVVEAEDDAQFSLQYKAGDDWSWTDLAYRLTKDEQGQYLVYIVESDDMAMLIADRGLVIQGIRYKISCISVFGTETLPHGIDESNASAKAVKILHNGQLLILRNDVIYTINGQIFE